METYPFRKYPSGKDTDQASACIVTDEKQRATSG